MVLTDYLPRGVKHDYNPQAAVDHPLFKDQHIIVVSYRIGSGYNSKHGEKGEAKSSNASSKLTPVILWAKA